MKKKPILLSLLVIGILSIVLTVGVVFAKYKSTIDLQQGIDLSATKPDYYTYAVLDKDTKALSIRNRPAIVSDGKLIDKDGTYDIATEIYALPTGADGSCVAENPNTPTGAITGVWTFQTYDDLLHPTDFETSVTSVIVADPIKLTGNLQNMFYKFGALTTADLTNADFSAVTGLSGFFDACSSLTTVLFAEDIDTSKVTSMQKMFNNCGSLVTVDVSNFDTQEVKSMEDMFYYCENLENIDVSKFNTSKVTSMRNMFHNCKKVSVLDVSKFDTSNVTSMWSMFKYTNVTMLDLSNFVVTVDTDIAAMFDDCRQLKIIYASEKFVANPNADNVFRWCKVLVGGNETKVVDYSGWSGKYAVIDGVNGQQGYFTAKEHTHNIVDTWVGKTDASHSKYCSVYGEPLETEKHTYNEEYTCTVCDYVCQHSTLKNYTSYTSEATTHYGDCLYCGKQNLPETHSFSKGMCSKCKYECTHTAEWNITADKHSGTCTICNLAINEVHTYENGVCVKCQYQCQHSDTTITPNEDGTTHIKKCTVCAHIIETVEHTYGEGVLDSESGVTTYTCSACGHTKTETPSEDTTGNEENGGKEPASNEQESAVSEETTSPENVAADPVLPPSEGSEDAENGTDQTEGQQDQE